MSTPTPPPPPADAPVMSTPPPPAGPTREEMLAKVKGPALAMMIVAGLTFVLEIVGILANLLGISLMGMGQPDMSQFEGMEGMEWLAPLMSGAVAIVWGIVVLIAAAAIFYGAMKMKDLQSYGLAMTASILSLIPCFSFCCVGIPFGIWALVVLLNQDVKQAFV